MKLHIILCCLTTLLVSSGCQQTEPVRKSEGGVRTPVTSFGQAVGQAKGISREADQYNRALKEQAGE